VKCCLSKTDSSNHFSTELILRKTYACIA